VWIQISAHILDKSVNLPRPIRYTWVRLETKTGKPLQTTETNEVGEFTFGDVRTGRFLLQTPAPRFGEKVRTNIDVPAWPNKFLIRVFALGSFCQARRLKELERTQPLLYVILCGTHCSPVLYQNL
jgi:hypothetical protein